MTRAARSACLLLIAGTLLSQPARAQSSASHSLHPSFAAGGGTASAASHGLTGCFERSLGGVASSTSHILLAGCGSTLVLDTDDQILDFFTVNPCRVLDTRLGSGPFVSGTNYDLTVGGVCGVPSTAKVLFVNVTVVSPPAQGHLLAFAKNLPPPSQPLLLFSAGITRANNGAVRIATENLPQITLRPHIPAGGAVHAIVDVAGYAE